MQWIVFNLSLSFLVFIAFYAIWCVVRTHLLFVRLKHHYDEFENHIIEAIAANPSIEDEIYREEVCARILLQRTDCFRTTSKLNAFSVYYFKSSDVTSLVSRHVPESSLPVVQAALKQLRFEKCNAIEFYIRYCKLSGYIWALWALINGIDVREFRKKLSAVVEFLLRPEVASCFSNAPLRWDQTAMLDQSTVID